MDSQQRENKEPNRGDTSYPLATDYVNTIAAGNQPPYPGRLEIEQRISNIIRWNAMSMVVRANKEESGIGGHIASYASSATFLEVGFNHFFRGRSDNQDGDLVYLQGHASPGIYARAFLEGRLSGFDLSNFRRELSPEGGLPSYPHPKLMPDFWQFPTVSMGLTSLQAIYEARFIRYLENRGLKNPSDQKIWAFMGDGEMDEPESLGAITMGSREKLDNLIFVINCNLQRLDGPVRGNGKIVQELESLFTGAGWNVIKLLWGSEWDPLFEKDTDGLLVKRLNEIVDGQLQKYSVSSGDFIRQDLFGTDPKLLKLVENYSDEQLENLKRGGHDPFKIYAAFKAAVEHVGAPTLILAQTVKGFGMGTAGEGLNITHQQKKMNEDQLLAFRTRFGIPVPDYEVQEAPFYKPADESEEITYLQKCRGNLGGYIPSRVVNAPPLASPEEELFGEFYQGSGKHAASSTMSMVRLLSKLIKDPNMGQMIVPIVPDEARTFGMEPLFRQAGIYSSAGQLYEPVDREYLLYYDERKDGAILEEGISEAGSMSSFIAAGNAYATHGINTIPFYLFYSMFGVQRMIDLIWAAGDMMVKGFLLGGISGKTTLAGEGLQHQDGHGHHTFLSVPNLKAYDPAFAYEQAVIVREGLRRMYHQQKDEFYYISMMNEAYHMPPMPAGCEQGILKGLYKFKSAEKQSGSTKVNLLGSGAILPEVIKAQNILESEFGIAADVWSVTSYKELYTDALEVQRQNMLHPDQPPRQSYLSQCFADAQGVFVAASDYMKALPCMLSQWIPGRLVALGTDGFGRSDTRGALRNYFEVSAEFIVLASLHALMQDGKIDPNVITEVIQKMEIDPEKINPMLI
ncbi:MAG: pyruvate dehydrogenase (acetyl-transferring), homodimeric type [Planctomycetota bacterium]